MTLTLMNKTRVLGERAPKIWSVLAFFLALGLTVDAKAIVRDCELLFRESTPSKRLVVELTPEATLNFSSTNTENFRSPVVKIRTARGEILLHKLEDPSLRDGTGQLLDIAGDAKVYFFATSRTGERRALDLPIWLKNALRDYVRGGGPPTKPFDCNCFAHLLNGVTYKFESFQTRLWSLEQVVDSDAIRIGDTLLLGYSKNEITHVAVNIGEGLYISKFGIDGPVLVTTIEALQLIYGGMPMVSGKPIPNANAVEVRVEGEVEN